MPSRTLAKVDLPEPEAPNTTVILPAGMMAVMPFKIGVSLPGAVATTSLRTTSAFGSMCLRASSLNGCASSKSRKRMNASFTVKKAVQVETIISMGAKALDISTLAAIMPPGDSSP